MFIKRTTINASPIEIFQYWEDTESWYLWNDGLLNFSLPHGFCYGSKGWLVGSSGKRRQFSLVHFDYPKSFTAEFRVPFGCLLAHFHFRIWQGQTEVTIEARFMGRLTSIYKRFYGFKVEEFMSTTLDGLKQAAEQGLKPAHSVPSSRTVRAPYGTAKERHINQAPNNKIAHSLQNRSFG